MQFGKSIKAQLIVLLFGLTAASILVVGFIGIRGLLDSGTKAETITSKSAQKRSEEFLVQTTAATATKNTQLFKNIESQVANVDAYTENVFSDPGQFTTAWKFDQHVFRQPTGQWWNPSTELPNILIGNFAVPDAAMKKEIELLHNLDFLAPQVLKSNSDAVALYFIGTTGTSFYYPNIDLGNIIPPDLNPNTLDFFTVATPEADPNKEVRWTDVYDDPVGNGLTITASSPVYETGGAFRGVTSMDITLSNIAKNIEDYSPIESSYAFLIDHQGRAVAFPAQAYKDILNRDPKKGEFGVDLKKVKGEFGTVLGKMRGGKEGFATVGAKDGNLYVAYAPVAGSSFSLGIVAKEDVLLKVLGDLRAQVKDSTNQVLYYQILPITVVILLIVWVTGFIYIRLLTEPIIELTKKTKRVMQGSFTQDFTTKTANNEVGELASSFNKMTMELASSYKALQQRVAEVSDAKAKDDAILGSIGDGMIVTDSSGYILLINTIAAEFLGVDGGSAIGHKIPGKAYDQQGAPIAEEDRPIYATLSSGKMVSRELLLGRQDGSKVALSITANPVLQKGNIIGAIEIMRDITKEKEVDRMKTEFISVASHQLRTPLSAIKWFSEMLLKGDAGTLQVEQAEFVKNISVSTDRMIDLVNALLNVSRLESGRIIVSPQPTDLKEMITGIIDDVKSKITEHGQTIELTVDSQLPKINLDARLISQVYLNLLTNAINYTGKDGKIDVSVYQKDGQVVSKISDTGFGIPKAEQPQLFQKFYRGSNIMQVETDGTGLGLYLVKSIVESSGGKIWFESTQDKGTTFWFSLPVSGMKAKAGEVKLEKTLEG